MVDSTNCSSLEEVAAFAEGRLRGTERERVIAHLAGCADCREVLAATVETAEELDAEDDPSVVAVMARKEVGGGRRFRWAALGTPIAATLALVTGLVFWQLHTTRTPPEPSDWLAAMPAASELAPHVWGGVRLRGGGAIAEPDAQSAELGALLVDVEVTIAGADAKGAQDALRRMATILDDAGFMDTDVETLRALAERTDVARMKASWAKAKPALEKHLGERFDPFYQALGTFLEEAHVAASAGDREFLAASRPRRHLKWLLRQPLPEQVGEPVRDALRVLARESASDKERAEASLEALRALTG